MKLVVAGLLVVALVGVAGYMGSRRVGEAADSACMRQSNCTNCHEDRVPRSHTPEFVARTHGQVAIVDRVTCDGCHERKSCDDCHQKNPPPWHTDAFRNPGRGSGEREEHTRVGKEHRASCMECHTPRFRKQCSECHRPDEWPR